MLTDKFPGFLNHYSTTAMAEDKAEGFANLMGDRAKVDARSQRDPVIHAKVHRMQELLADFCRQADDDFWNRARDLKRADK